ncbi:hypothetical protein Tco_0226655 [Tanacetum coccineum]
MAGRVRRGRPPRGGNRRTPPEATIPIRATWKARQRSRSVRRGKPFGYIARRIPPPRATTDNQFAPLCRRERDLLKQVKELQDGFQNQANRRVRRLRQPTSECQRLCCEKKSRKAARIGSQEFQAVNLIGRRRIFGRSKPNRKKERIINGGWWTSGGNNNQVPMLMQEGDFEYQQGGGKAEGGFEGGVGVMRIIGETLVEIGQNTKDMLTGWQGVGYVGETH